MKNAFIGITSRLNMTEERISKLKAMSIETSKIEKQRGKKKNEKNKTKNNIIPMDCESTTKDVTYI